MATLCLANIRCIFSENDRTYGTVTTPLDFSCALSGNLINPDKLVGYGMIC